MNSNSDKSLVFNRHHKIIKMPDKIYNSKWSAWDNFNTMSEFVNIYWNDVGELLSDFNIDKHYQLKCRSLYEALMYSIDDSIDGIKLDIFKNGSLAITHNNPISKNLKDYKGTEFFGKRKYNALSYLVNKEGFDFNEIDGKAIIKYKK